MPIGRNPFTDARKRPLRLLGIRSSRHLEVAAASLAYLLRTPLATAMTVSVIAIALALPAALYLLTRNLNDLDASWGRSTAISLFLTMDTDLAQARILAQKLAAHPRLERVDLIHPEDALSDLAGNAGFSEAIAQLEENPLPIVLAVQPVPDLTALVDLERLTEGLESLPQAEFARLDTQWIRRFQTIVELAQRGVELLGSILAIAVVLVIGNTIRLEIQSRRDEIEIMELVGATPAFIRRPFLYTGLWYGLLGGVGAWLLVVLAFALIREPVAHLAVLYNSSHSLSGLGPAASLALLGCGSGLGLIGSRLSVGRHLAATEPR